MKKLIWAVTVLAVSIAQADTIYVVVNCPGPGNGSVGDPYFRGRGARSRSECVWVLSAGALMTLRCSIPALAYVLSDGVGAAKSVLLDRTCHCNATGINLVFFWTGSGELGIARAAGSLAEGRRG